MRTYVHESPVFRQPESVLLARHGNLYVLLILFLIWIPIPIGSNRGWSLAILEAGTLFIVGAWALSYTFRPFELPETIYRVRYPLVILVLWALYPLIQLIPLSPGTSELTGNEFGALYHELPTRISSTAAYLTVDRNATFSGFIRQCSIVALIFTVIALTNSVARLRGLLIVMLSVGFLEALYGLLVSFGGGDLPLWDPGHAQATVSGTYVNQNHFAGLLEVTIPVGLGLLLSTRLRHERLTSLRPITRSLSDFVLSRRAVILFCTLVMTAALIMTASRGGIGAIAIGITVAVSVALWKKGVRARERAVGMVAILLAAIAVIWLGSGRFFERLQTAGISIDRGDLRELSMRIFSDNPLFGTGVGTFRWVFPSYKDERFGSYFYEHAHNDFLEVLSEQGIIGFSLLTVGILLFLARMIGAYGRRHDPLIRGTLFAAIAGCVAFLVHGFVDFNFHIPANAIYFFALLGLGTVATDLKDSSTIGYVEAKRDFHGG